MKRYLPLFKGTWKEFGDDKAQRLAAALAYYTIFSIAPLMLIAIAIAGLFFGRSQAQAQIVGQLQTVFGPSGAKAVQQMLANASEPKSGTMAIIVGSVILIFGATGVFMQLEDALNTIWNVEKKKSDGILMMIKDRLLSLGMVLGIGFLLLVSLVVDAAISSTSKFGFANLPGGAVLWQAIQLCASLGVVTVLFAMIFKLLPHIDIEWHDVWFGAFFTAILFVIGKFALGLWLGRKSVGSAYGAAGSLVVLLMWIYWSANILFFGAEFTQVYARKHGSKRATESQAAPAKPAPRPNAVVVRPSGGASALPVAAAGGVVGLLLGALVGGMGAVFVFFKSVKKLIP